MLRQNDYLHNAISGEIRDIYLNQKPGSSIDTDEIELRVRMFYRYVQGKVDCHN